MEPLKRGVSIIILSDFSKALSRLSSSLTSIEGVYTKSEPEPVEEEFTAF